MKTNAGLQKLKDTVKLYEGFIKDGKATEESYRPLINRLIHVIGMIENGITKMEFETLTNNEKWDVSACIKTVFFCPDCKTPSKPKRAFMGSIECEECEHTLTFRTNGGQSDPFNWIIKETPVLPQTDFTKQIQVDKFDAQMYINTLESDISIWGQLTSDGAKARVQITQQHLDSAKKLLGL